MDRCPDCDSVMVAETDNSPTCGCGSSRAADPAGKRGSERIVTDGGTPTESDGLSRRKLLLGGGTAVAAGGSATAFLLFSDGNARGPPPEESPRKKALAFTEALYRHDLEDAESMLHPDSPVDEISPLMAPMSSTNQESSVESARVVQQNATHARVAVQVNWVHDDDVIDRTNSTVLLEAHEGEWLVIPRMQ